CVRAPPAGDLPLGAARADWILAVRRRRFLTRSQFVGWAPLLRRNRRVGDELRRPHLAALQVGAVERLEFGLGEGMSRGTRHQRAGPGLEPRECLDCTERLDAIEEHIALQEWRIGGVNQRIFGAVEERPRALL